MLRRGIVLALAAVTLWVLPTVPASAVGPTYVTANISTNTTWTLAGSPYIVNTASLWITAGVTLTIEPGVKVVMNYATLGQQSLVVYGQLQAIGTLAAPIVFTSGQDHFGNGGARGQWKYIRFAGASTGTLAFVEIRYAGGIQSAAPYAYSALWMDSSVQVQLDHAWIHANYNSGIKATSSAPMYISGTIIHDNDIGVSAVGTSGGTVVIEHSSLSYNRYYGLFTNHSSAPVMQSVISYSNIAFNNAAGVRLQEVGSTPTAKYPTGNHNNIYNNAGDSVDEISLLYPRVTSTEALWESNYWGEYVSMAPICLWAPTAWQFHLVDMTDPSYPQKGPIPSTVWTQPGSGLKCRTDNLRVWEWLAYLEPNLVPDSPPW